MTELIEMLESQRLKLKTIIAKTDLSEEQAQAVERAKEHLIQIDNILIGIYNAN